MLATEADVLRTLRTGTYTLAELYGLCERRVSVARDGGHDPIPSCSPQYPPSPAREWRQRHRSPVD